MRNASWKFRRVPYTVVGATKSERLGVLVVSPASEANGDAAPRGRDVGISPLPRPVPFSTAAVYGQRYADGECFEGRDFSGSHFHRFAVKGGNFLRCKFQYCIFEDAYLNGAIFEHCDFTGSKFVRSNLRNATFSNCHFWYVSFSDTIVDAKTMRQCLPPQPSRRQELARSLRANFAALGMHKDADTFLEEELSAEQQHFLYAAWPSRAPEGSRKHYETRYEGKRREYWWSFIKHYISGFYWGHGLSLKKLATSSAIGGSILWLVFVCVPDAGLRTDQTFYFHHVYRIWPALFYAVTTFFAADYLTPTTSATRIATVVTILFGYLSLALFVTVLYRRLARA